MCNRAVLFLLWIALWGGVACSAVSPPETPQLRGAILLTPVPAPDFVLPNAAGDTVRLSDFHGKIVLLYFGYTFCPDVCPTTLFDLSQIQQQLDNQAEQIQVVMVTVDPQRDTAEVLSQYVKSFHETFIGLSGTPEEIAAAAAAYGVVYEPEDTGDNFYFVAHTASVFLIDQQGVFRLMYPFGMSKADIISDLKILLMEE